ncbi:class I SAM-dependent methyltransferase [Streptomyces sp. NPDC085929]|uniref:class I SAM-dependent methyltransferase n=1 Tax=Streptomyces sp. NPDC085929 TaxID=3365739 RepID=UPI0037D2549E
MYATRDEYVVRARTYDDDYPPLADDDPMIAFMRNRISEGARVVEFGIGTGRVAIPLLHSGCRLWGIDISAEMLARLAAKDEANGIETMEGSFLDTRAPGAFAAVVCVFNTLYHVHAQDGQVQALKAAADHLEPDGFLFLENTSALHITERYGDGSRILLQDIGNTSLWLLAAQMCAIEQRLRITHIKMTDSGTSLAPVTFRYIWPAELRLMAQQAGLQIAEEYGDWSQHPFDGSSTSHIVVMRKNGRPTADDALPAHRKGYSRNIAD